MRRSLWAGVGLVSSPTLPGCLAQPLPPGLTNCLAGNRSPLTVFGEWGAGEKKITESEPYLIDDLAALVEPLTRGDPESPLRWVSKSTRKLANMLNRQGYSVSRNIVATLLHEAEYSLQANKKRDEGAKDQPDRDAQFTYIARKTAQFQRQWQPVISVDTKKKENVGNYKNPGREYRQQGHPRDVKAYDFVGKLGKVIPYGIYDVTFNKGWVSVGISHDTAAFAVHSIRTWWYELGCRDYPGAYKLFITADCGGSNGYRVRLWKVMLQALANELQQAIHVSHYPPGTSKWNKIEHRLFNWISQNWQGQPLTDYETILALICHAGTEAGLEIHAQLDEAMYPTGIKIADSVFEQLNIYHYAFHGEWNYKISPQP